MNVVKSVWPDGSATFQVVEATSEEMTTLHASMAPNEWITANATVTATVTSGGAGGPVVTGS